MILTFCLSQLSHFNYVLNSPLKAAVEKFISEINTWNLFEKCMSLYFS